MSDIQTLQELQARQQAWADAQPWERGDGTYALLGVIEEVGELAGSLPIKKGYLDDEARQVVLLATSLGELAHAILKKRQGIRKNQDHDFDAYMARTRIRGIIDGHVEEYYLDHTERSDEDAQDAAGDIMIYLLDIFNRRVWDLQDTLQTTCDAVFARNWNVSPNNGVSE